MIKNLELNYGRKKIKLAFPIKNLLGIIKGKEIPQIKNPIKSIASSLNHPIESPPIKSLVKSGEKIVILVSDKTRITGANFFLPPLINQLNDGGVKEKDISIIFTLGAHLKQSEEEKREIVGEKVAQKIALFDHDCHKNLVRLGTTSFGTPVEINRKVVEADKVILTGSITYHYYAGFTGGRKSIMPGVASFESIQANHSLVLNPSQKGFHPLAITGNLKGNPVHEDMIEATRMIKPAFLINTVFNEKGKLAGIFCGQWIRAHDAGCRFYDAHNKVKIKNKAECVIVSAGGYPKDINFVQAHKAMDNAAYALKEGGVMIVLAECLEGYPSSTYLEWFSLGSSLKIEEKLRAKYSVAGHTVYSALKKAERFQIILVSKLNPEDVKKMKMTPLSSLEKALEIARKTLGSNFSTYVMPEGVTTLPQI